MSVKTIPAEQAERFGHGNCVAFIERNGYDDSDFLGVFAYTTPDGATAFRMQTTGSTRYAGGFVAVPDATPEVVAAYQAKREDVFAGLAAERAEREARTPAVGKTLTVVDPPTRGKNKVPAGATGECVYRDVNAYDSRWAIANDRRTYRVGVMIDGVKVFLDERRVRVTGHEDADLPTPGMGQVDYIIAANWPEPQV